MHEVLPLRLVAQALVLCLPVRRKSLGVVCLCVLGATL